jgi:hypothetical protein
MKEENKIRQLLALDREILQVAEHLAKLKDERNVLEKVVERIVADQGYKETTLDTGEQVVLTAKLHASKRGECDLSEFHAMLRAHGLGDFIREAVSPQRLSGWIREIEREQKEISSNPNDYLPKALREAINVYRKTGVHFRGVRK